MRTEAQIRAIENLDLGIEAKHHREVEEESVNPNLLSHPRCILFEAQLLKRSKVIVILCSS
jgi:hypothetical protein